jgi:hypothetical protein
MTSTLKGTELSLRTTLEENMRDASRRPLGRLFHWAVTATMALGFAAQAHGAAPVPQSGNTTTVADTVYMADGTPASGILIITWPAFETASGTAVAGGTTSVTLGTNGALSVALEPNAGATPAGVYYTVVYQLQPSEVKTEYWVVPVSTSPVTLATVRATPGSGAAAQPVSTQYVNTQLALKANDDAVVHLAGSETITGVKSFDAVPNVPTPVNPGDVANKSYVDQSVANVGAGSFLPLAGGAMTGPITLPANPVAPMQASTKQYVDTGLASAAELISGLVPTNELGSGLASSGSCLIGNGASATWGACGGGSGSGNLSTNPAATQAIAQPEGTQFSTNNLANIRYVTASWNWAQTPSDNLSTPGSLTIHLAPCPLGLDTNSSAEYYTYKVYIAGTGTAEAVPVTGGSCAPGSANGTITVTTAYAHGAGYTVGSASGGIQEAWNDAWVSDGGELETPYVKLAANQQYNVYATVYLRGRGGMLDGAGSLILCSTRDRCIYIGTTEGVPYVHHHKLYNLSGSSTVNVDGVQVAGVSASSGTYTVTAASAHSFVVGDMVDCEYHATTSDQHWVAQVASVPSSTTFTVNIGSTTFAAGTTFGFCNLLNAFVENNSDHVVVQDINIFQTAAGAGYFSYGVVNDNDQQFIVERAANRSSIMLKSSANWPIGSFFYQRTDQGNAGITYVHNSELTGVNCATGGGNGFVMSDSVCQGFPMYGIRYFGGLQPATFTNIYQESTGSSTNPLYGYAAQAGIVVQGGTGAKIVGTFPISGYEPGFAVGGGSAAERTYFVVPRSSTLGYGPMLLIGWAEPATTSTSIQLEWPSIELQTSTGQSVGTLTWDVLVVTGTSAVPPYGTGTFAIATNISASCGTNGMCSFTDTQEAASSYTVAAQQFAPTFWFWPVNLVINNGIVLVDQIGTDPQAVASEGTLGVSIVAEQCLPGGWTRRRSPIWVSCVASSNGGGSGASGTVLQELDQANNGPSTNSKGRLNFGKPIGNVPNDLLTLQDSNFTKTMATAGQRPSNDAGDMALGLDQTGGLTERAATSISSYINALPTGTNYLERLTATGKTLNVPLTVNGNLSVTSGTVTLPVTGSGNQCLHVSSTGVVSGTGADCGSGSGGGGSGTVNSGAASQLAFYSGAGTAVNGDSALTDNGSTLNYTGAGGITAAAGTFSGNLTVNGQLLVAGPWMVSSPIPGTAMGASSAGTSSLGISNDGNFYISNNAGTPQKVATTATSSYFTNLTQEDANDVGQFTVGETAAQNLHVYSTYTNSSSWQRTSVGFDATDGYAVLRSESSTAGAAPGLGFWLNNGLKWVIDASSTLKPWTDESYNIGTFTASTGVGLRPATVYVAGNSTSNSGFELGKFASNSYELCNDGTTGTVIDGLAVLTSAGCAVKPTSAATSGVIGVVIANAGTSGTVTLVRTGSAYCNFDATATVVGDYVVPSPTQYPASSGFYPLCHDAGSSLPSGAQILGRVLQATSGGTTAQMFFDMPGSNAGPGQVSSVFGRTGTVTAASGDYTVSQVTGAAPLASPTFTGTVTEPDGTTNTSSGYTFAHALTLPSGSVATTQAQNDSSTKIATDAFAHGVVPPDAASSVWMTVPHASSSGTVFSTSSNKAAFFGVMLGYQKTTSQVSYYVATADTSSTTYDLGIYSGTSGGTCTLQAHTGSIAGSTAMTAGAHTVSWTGGSVTLQPGRYYLALTASATSSTAVLYGDSAGVTFAGGTGTSNVGNASISSGGTLPATATCPTDSVQVAALIPAWLVD